MPVNVGNNNQPSDVTKQTEQVETLPVIKSDEAVARKDYRDYQRALPVPVVTEEYSDNEEYAENIDVFKQDDSEEHNEAQSFLDLASAYINMGDREEAIAALKEAIQKGSPETRKKAYEMLETLA